MHRVPDSVAALVSNLTTTSRSVQRRMRCRLTSERVASRHSRKVAPVLSPRTLLTFAAAIVLASWPAAGADLHTYHGFALGMSTADVVAHAGAKDADVKTLHEQPSLLQELSWRRPYQSEPTADDSIDAIVFNFVDGRLFKMTVSYETDRTQGLTKEDVIESLAAIYGPRSTVPVRAARRSEFESIDTPIALAAWSDADSTITLNQSPFSQTYGLVITSTTREALARKALAVATSRAAREAPAREAARAKADAEAERAAATKTRATNRAGFQP